MKEQSVKIHLHLQPHNHPQKKIGQHGIGSGMSLQVHNGGCTSHLQRHPTIYKENISMFGCHILPYQLLFLLKKFTCPLWAFWINKSIVACNNKPFLTYQSTPCASPHHHQKAQGPSNALKLSHPKYNRSSGIIFLE